MFLLLPKLSLLGQETQFFPSLCCRSHTSLSSSAQSHIASFIPILASPAGIYYHYCYFFSVLLNSLISAYKFYLFFSSSFSSPTHSGVSEQKAECCLSACWVKPQHLLALLTKWHASMYLVLAKRYHPFHWAVHAHLAQLCSESLGNNSKSNAAAHQDESVGSNHSLFHLPEPHYSYALITY